MKDLRDVKKDYGYILRWLNGWGNENGNTYEYTFFLENVENADDRIYISDSKGEVMHPKALEYIKKVTTNAFRNNAFVYKRYAELFEIMGIKKK